MEEVFERLGDEAKSALLTRIVTRCTSSPDRPTPVVVFDLDGTLMDNRPRTLQILRELGAVLRAREPQIAEKLLSARPSDLSYLLTDSLRKLGVQRTEVVRQAEIFWRERFFTDTYLQYDVEVPGAAKFANDCYEAGGILVYFTGRDLPLMGLGSFGSLRDLGFPIGVPGTELVLKPDANMPDEAFKRMSGPRLSRVGEVVAIFDNEPGNCNVLGEHFPNAEIILLDTQCLPGAPPLAPRVQVVGDFLR